MLLDVWHLKDCAGEFTPQTLYLNDKQFILSLNRLPKIFDRPEAVMREALVAGSSHLKLDSVSAVTLDQFLPHMMEKSKFHPIQAPRNVGSSAGAVQLSPIHRWSSLGTFILLSLSGDVPKSIPVIGSIPIDFHSSEDTNERRLLASAMAIALNNADCRIPAFIQCDPKFKNAYYGLSIGGYLQNRHFVDSRLIETRTKMLVLAAIPNSYSQLNSLIQIFRNRFNCVAIPADSDRGLFASILVRYDNIDAVGVPDTTQLYDLEDTRDLDLCIQLETKFPLSPIEAFVGMNIDPVLAPEWNVIIKNNQKKSRLSASWKRATRDWKELDSYNPLFGAKSNLAIPGSFINDRIRNIQSLGAEDERSALLDLFNNSICIEPIPYSRKLYESDRICSTEQLISLLRSKSVTVPKGSLSWNFARKLFDSCGSGPSLLRLDTALLISTLENIWDAFIAELKKYWRDLLVIPGVNESGPDASPGINTNHNLFHQKLSMINCCIMHKQQEINLQEIDNIANDADKPAGRGSPRILENAINSLSLNTDAGTDTPNEGMSWKTDQSWLESFSPLVSTQTKLPFGSSKAQHSTMASNNDLLESQSASVFSFESFDIPAERPRGQMNILAGASLRNGEALWIPFTQNHGYFTEDMLKEREDKLEDIKNHNVHAGSYSGVEVGPLLSGNLISYVDMEAFKAANIGCVFEDFILWHSPRDLADPTTEYPFGILSERMSDPLNLWQTCWKVRYFDAESSIDS